MRIFGKRIMTLVLAALGVLAANGQEKEWTGTDWLGLLPDDALVCQLSLPGAHDAATGEGWVPLSEIPGNLNSKTQEVKVAEMYHSGVRVFDIRPYNFLGTVYNSHGITRLKKSMEELLDEMAAFLKEHPTEFFIFHVFKGGTDWEAEPFRKLITKEKYANLLQEFKATMTVGEMRGKFLFLCRHDHEGKTWKGGYLREWGERGYDECRNAYITPNGDGYPFDENSGRLHVQDIAGAHDDNELNEEIASLGRLLDFSTRHEATSAYECIWTFNFASGCSKHGIGGISLSDGYRHNATHTNKYIVDYLTAPDYVPGPTGMIMTDFLCVETTTFSDKSLATNGNKVYGKQIIDAIIENNFRCSRAMLTGKEDVPTAISDLDGADTDGKARKTIVNNGIGIRVNGIVFDLQGRRMR